MMKDNVSKLDWDDEVLAKTVLTHAGEIRNHVPKQKASDGGAIKDTTGKPAAKVA